MLNDVLPQALALIDPAQRPHVVHQTGALQRDAVRDAYTAAGVHDGVEVLPFIDDMAAQLAACDVIVCRAGAITVSELCAARSPAFSCLWWSARPRTSATTRCSWRSTAPRSTCRRPS